MRSYRHKNDFIFVSHKTPKASYITHTYLTAYIGSAIVDNPALGCPLSVRFWSNINGALYFYNISWDNISFTSTISFLAGFGAAWVSLDSLVSLSVWVLNSGTVFIHIKYWKITAFSVPCDIALPVDISLFLCDLSKHLTPLTSYFLLVKHFHLLTSLLPRWTLLFSLFNCLLFLLLF